MALFHAVERSVWQRALFVVLLLLAAGLLYTLNNVSSRQTGLPVEPVALEHLAAVSDPLDEVEPVRARVTVEPLRSSSFDEYRLERERSRSLQMEQLRQLLAADTLSGADQQLVSELLALLERTEKELESETLLRARGLADALVVVADTGVIVVVPEPITQTEASSIGSIVSQVTGTALEQITISDGTRLP